MRIILIILAVIIAANIAAYGYMRHRDNMAQVNTYRQPVCYVQGCEV